MEPARGVGSREASTSEVLDGLNDLLQLDHDAIGSYEIAIEKLEDRDQAAQIAGFKNDHERHIQNLNEAIAALGGTPKNEPHATGPLKQALQSLGATAGDKGILMAFRTNEMQVRNKYDSYASKAMFWPADVKRLVDRNALDEERHYRWVADVLQAMGVGAGADGGVMDMAREGVNQIREKVGEIDMDDVSAKAREVGEQVKAKAGEVGEQVKAKAGEALESARTGLASGLATAADRLDGMAEQREGRGGTQAKLAGTAHGVAGGLDRTADYIRQADSQMMRQDLEDRVKTSPAQTLLLSFGIGFVIGRIIR